LKRQYIVPALLAALAACTSVPTVTSPGGAQGARLRFAAPSTRPSWITRELRHSTKPLLYVADTYANEVAVYVQRGRGQQPVGELTTDITFPTGLWVDTHRNLWVANSYSELESNILRFPQGATKPDLTIPDASWNVSGVWVARDRSVYAINSGYYGNFEIVKYPPHSVVSQVVGDPNLTSDITAIAADAHGNLFASGLAQSGGGEVDELPSGSTSWQNTRIPLVEPGGLALDRSGALVVSDIGRDVIEVFPIGHKKPSITINCSAQCWAVALNHRATTIWVDEVNDLNGTIDEFSYRKGRFIQTLPQPQDSYPQSVATTPDLY